MIMADLIKVGMADYKVGRMILNRKLADFYI